MKSFTIKFAYHCEEGFTTGTIDVEAANEEAARTKFKDTIAPELTQAYHAVVDIMDVTEK